MFLAAAYSHHVATSPSEKTFYLDLDLDEITKNYPILFILKLNVDHVEEVTDLSDQIQEQVYDEAIQEVRNIGRIALARSIMRN